MAKAKIPSNPRPATIEQSQCPARLQEDADQLAGIATPNEQAASRHLASAVPPSLLQLPPSRLPWLIMPRGVLADAADISARHPDHFAPGQDTRPANALARGWARGGWAGLGSVARDQARNYYKAPKDRPSIGDCDEPKTICAKALTIMLEDLAIREWHGAGESWADISEGDKDTKIAGQRAMMAELLASKALTKRRFATGRVALATDRGPDLMLVQMDAASGERSAEAEGLGRQEIALARAAVAAVLAASFARDAAPDIGMVKAREFVLEDFLSKTAAMRWLRWLKAPPEVLVIATKAGRTQGLYFAGGAGSRAIMAAHCQRQTDVARPEVMLRAVLGRHPGRSEYWLSGDTGDTALCALLDASADHLLDALLTGNRPVARWRTNFFQPVPRRFGADAADNKLPEGGVRLDPAKTIGYPERDYFLPHLKRLWGDGDAKDALASYSLYPQPALGGETEAKPQRRWLAVDNALYADPLVVEITAIRLHRFGDGDDDSDILEWEVAAQDDHLAELAMVGSDPGRADRATVHTSTIANEILPEKPAEKSLWRRYLATRKHVQWSLAQAIDFIANARFNKYVYRHEVELDSRNPESPRDIRGIVVDMVCALSECEALKQARTFRAARMPGAGPSSASDKPLATLQFEDGAQRTWLAAMLRPGEACTGLELPGDDRARVFTSLILEGDKSDDPGLLPALAQINMVDPYSSGNFYPDSTADADLAASKYQRFWDSGNHFMATDHSFSFVGYRHHDELRHHKFNFAERLIHMVHMSTIYRRLFLIALFQQTGLRDIESSASDIGLSRKIEAIAKLRQRYLDFVNNRWFVNISTQLQGQEIYDLLRKQFSLEDQIALIDKKLIDLHGFTEGAAQRREKAVTRLIEYVGLPIAILVIIRELMYTGNDETSESLKPIIHRIFENSIFINEFWFLVLCAVVITSIVTLLRFLLESEARDIVAEWQLFSTPVKRSSWLIVLATVIALAIAIAALCWEQPTTGLDKAPPASHGSLR